MPFKARAGTARDGPGDGVSEDMYRGVFNAIDEGLVLYEMLFDEDGNAFDAVILDHNPQWERMAGAAGMVGRRVSEVFPDVEPTWNETFGHVALTGEAIRFENYYAHFDRWYNLHVSRIGGADSRLLAAVISDVTFRKRHEAWQAYLVKLNDVLRPLTDPVDLQAEAATVLGTHLGANRVFYAEVDGDHVVVHRDFVRDVASLAGRYRLSDFGSSFVPDLVAGRTTMLTDVLTDPRITPFLREAFAAIDVRSGLGVPLVKDGRLVSIFGVYQSREHTWTPDEVEIVEETAERTWAAVERAQAEEALRRSEERFHAVADLVPDLLWHSDSGGYATWCNRRWLEYTGQSPEDAEGLGWMEVIHPEDRERSRASVQHAISTGEPVKQERRIRRHDGVFRWFLVRAIPVRDEGGRVQHWFGAATDIQDQHSMLEALEERVQERTQEVRTLATHLTRAEQRERRRISQILHDDLQQILFSVQMRTAAVSDAVGREGDPRVRKGLSDIESWIQTSIEKTRRLSVDLSPPLLKQEGLADALRWLQSQMEQIYDLKVEIEAAHAFQMEDDDVRVLLFLTVRELLFNVTKHAGVNRARVRLSESNGEVVIEVADEGSGYDVSALEQKRGFGLYSLQERLRLLGGRVEIDSRVGDGTRVTIHAPMGLAAPSEGH